MKGGEGLELAELLVQIGRGRADDEAVDALGGVGLRTAALHVDRTPGSARSVPPAGFMRDARARAYPAGGSRGALGAPGREATSRALPSVTPASWRFCWLMENLHL